MEGRDRGFTAVADDSLTQAVAGVAAEGGVDLAIGDFKAPPDKGGINSLDLAR